MGLSFSSSEEGGLCSLRRICPQPPYRPASIRTLALPVPFGVLNLLRVLPSPGSNSPPVCRKQWFRRPCSQSPELGDFAVRNQLLEFQAAAASASLLRNGS